jgi:hypothetical protein
MSFVEKQLDHLKRNQSLILGANLRVQVGASKLVSENFNGSHSAPMSVFATSLAGASDYPKQLILLGAANANLL